MTPILQRHADLTASLTGNLGVAKRTAVEQIWSYLAGIAKRVQDLADLTSDLLPDAHAVATLKTVEEWLEQVNDFLSEP